jgi:hypothetical protein
VKVVCACGQALLAPETMRGRSARCPGCGNAVSIPPADLGGGDLLNVDPLMMGHDPLAANPLAASRPTPAAAPAVKPQNPPWLLIGLGGGAAAAVLIAVVAIVASNRARRDVARVPPVPGPVIAGGAAGTPAAPPAAASGASSPPNAPAGVPPTTNSLVPLGSASTSGSAASGNSGSAPAPTSASANPAASTPSSASNPPAAAPSTTSASGAAPPPGGTGIALFPSAAQTWYGDARFRRRGLVKHGDAETPYGHFSWMTQLLPFLGHQKEYDQINFPEGLSGGKNIAVGLNVIPAFLNPLDDRRTWKGHPFHGLALTHFVGMAGIEDARNVVAASLPRSDPRAGVFGYDQVATPDQITDGTSQTIMVIGSGTMANPWIMGGGATIRGAREPYFDKVSGFGTRSLPQHGTLAVMADGSVRFISANVDPAAFRAMCTIHGSDSVDLERSAGPFLLESIVK